MPQRCSIPGCRTGYKQGLMLLCYPKDPNRRCSWVQALRNASMEPTNNQFICELHFGPDQWEKIRVDGTRKLKWAAVPNLFNPEEVALALERVKAISLKPIRGNPGFPTLAKNLETKPSPESDSSPKKVVIINEDLQCTKINPSNVKSDIQSNQTLKPLSNACHIHETDIVSPLPTSIPVIPSVLSVSQQVSLVHVPNASLPLPVRSVISPPSVLPVSSPPIKNATRVPKSVDCILPLTGPGHCIIIRVPKSNYPIGLAEDLDDVRSFLNVEEPSYENRLASALSELVKKHQKLDKERKIYEAKTEALKEKLENYEKVLVENYSLKEKVHKYEVRSIVENVGFKRKIRGCNGTVINVERVANPLEVLPDRKVNIFGSECGKWPSRLPSVVKSDQDSSMYVTLDDQL